MDLLSDEMLVESYHKAIELQLSPDFVHLIEQELIKRNLSNELIQFSS